MLDNVIRDVGYAARCLARKPLFTIVAVLPARRASAVDPAESLAAE